MTCAEVVQLSGCSIFVIMHLHAFKRRQYSTSAATSVRAACTQQVSACRSVGKHVWRCDST